MSQFGTNGWTTVTLLGSQTLGRADGRAGTAVLTILVSFLRCGVRCIGNTQSMIRS